MAWTSVVYFLFWAAAFALMMRFGCGSHIMGHGRRRQESPEEATRPHGKCEAVAQSATDPVCGMSVQTSAAKSAAFGGSIYYFCSADCRDKFESAPATYAKKSPASKEEHRHGSCCQ